MRILISGKYLNAPRGGAEHSARTLLSFLHSRGHVLAVFTINNDNLTKRDWPFSSDIAIKECSFSSLLHKKLIPGELAHILIERKMSLILDQLVMQFKPDIIISQGNYLLPRTYNKAKTIFFVRDYGFGSPLALSTELRALINLPFLRFRRTKIKRFDLILTISSYMQSILLKYGLKSEVIYPFMELRKYCFDTATNPPKQKYYTFISPNKKKGVEIFIKIAKCLTDHNFMVVGRLATNFKSKILSLPNVKWVSWQNNMSEIYRLTHILLVPSIWGEPFGRVPVEAAVNGIPTIASANAGLIESVGAGGILVEKYRDGRAWVEAIQSLDNNVTYAKLSLAALENAKQFAPERNFLNFARILEEKFAIKI